MRRLFQIVFAVVVASGCATPSPEIQVINAAADALGGASKIQSVNTITMEGGGMANNLGQARTPQGDDPVSPAEPTSTFEVTGFKRTIDLANGRAKQQWHRAPKFASPNPDAVQKAGRAFRDEDRKLDGNRRHGEEHGERHDRRSGRSSRRESRHRAVRRTGSAESRCG